MKTPHLTILILLSCWAITAQNNDLSKTQNWNNIISVSKMEGTQTSGFQFSYQKNNGFCWNDWLIPLSFGFQIKDIHEDIILELPYLSATKTQATWAFRATNPLRHNCFSTSK